MLAFLPLPFHGPAQCIQKLHLAGQRIAAAGRHVDVEQDEAAVIGHDAPSLIIQLVGSQGSAIGTLDETDLRIRTDAVEAPLGGIGRVVGTPERFVPWYRRATQRFRTGRQLRQRDLGLLNTKDVGRMAGQVVRQGLAPGDALFAGGIGRRRSIRSSSGGSTGGSAGRGGPCELFGPLDDPVPRSLGCYTELGVAGVTVNGRD